MVTSALRRTEQSTAEGLLAVINYSHILRRTSAERPDNGGRFLKYLIRRFFLILKPQLKGPWKSPLDTSIG